MSTITPSKAGGTGSTSLAAKLPAATLRQWLRDMLLIREFEVRTMQAYQDKKIGGFCHIYIGQEAVAVGSVGALNDDDPLVTAYRDHGHALARGMDPKYCMAEMFGRIGGCAKGKGGSMHLFDKDRHFYGGHGIVAAQCPLGAGLAFATKYEDEVINERKSSRVSMCFLGDGALNQGSFHEAMNLAGVLDLPIIFVVENNGYAMGTAIDRGTTMAHDLRSKALGYGMRGVVVDGMNVMNCYDGFKPLVDECRETSRPIFVDCHTYRYKGHSMSDPRKYRTKDEEATYEAKDPIESLTEFLQAEHGFTEADFKAMNKEVRTQVREAITWAEASPEPNIEEELHKDVYVEQFGPYNGTSLPQMFDER